MQASNNSSIAKFQCPECGEFFMVHDNEGAGAAVCPNGHGKVHCGIKEADIRSAKRAKREWDWYESLPQFKVAKVKDAERFVSPDGLVYLPRSKAALELSKAMRRNGKKGVVMFRLGGEVWAGKLPKKQPKSESVHIE